MRPADISRSEVSTVIVVVGVLEIRLALRESRSLKDKRHILQSLKDRLRHDFNVSVAEVDGQELLQSGTLAVAQVSSDSRYVRGSLEKVLQVVRRCRDAQLTDYDIEILHQ